MLPWFPLGFEVRFVGGEGGVVIGGGGVVVVVFLMFFPMTVVLAFYSWDP